MFTDADRVIIDADILAYELGHELIDEETGTSTTLEDVENRILMRQAQIVEGLPGINPVPLYAMTPGTTFRHDLATILPYKGHRKSDKPVFWSWIRGWLEDQAPLIWTWHEADDVLAWAMTYPEDWGINGKVVCATLDKDLRQVPGWHFKWSKKQDNTELPGWLEEVTPLQGHKNLWLQMLTGDDADNIAGITGVGKKSVHLDRIRRGTSVVQMYEAVSKLYWQHFKHHWFTFFYETLQLLYLKRSAYDSAEDYLTEHALGGDHDAFNKLREGPKLPHFTPQRVNHE